MAHEARTRPLPPPAAPARATASPTVMDRVDGALEGLWRYLSSMRVAMFIMLVIAVLGVVGSLVIQMPPGTAADPAARADWLAEVQPKYGALTGPMNALQVFEIFNSVYFRILVAGLTVSLIACSVRRIPGMVRTATNPRVEVSPAFFEHAPQHEAIVVRQSPAEALALVQGVLRGRRYRTLTTGEGTVHVYADRFRWAPFSGLIGHLSLVVILAGGILGAMFGYRDSQFTLAEGATLPVAAVPGLSIELLDFTDRYDPVTGGPIDYASQVVLYRDGAEIDRHTVRVNDPLRYEGLTFYQAFYGSAAVLTVTGADGGTIVSQGVPLAWRTTADNRPVGSFAIPGTDYVGWVLGTLGNRDRLVKPGQMQVELYTAVQGTRVDSRVVDQGKAVTMAGLTITFDRETQFTGLNIARDPGVPLIWIGSFLLFAGFLVRFMVPHKRVWGRIVPRPNGGAVLAMATLATRDVAQGGDFELLVNDVRAALQAPAQS